MQYITKPIRTFCIYLITKHQALFSVIEKRDWCFVTRKMHYFTCEINFFLHSINLILFTLLLVHLILRTSLDVQSLSSLSLSITPWAFHHRLETHLFHKSINHSLSGSILTAFADFGLELNLLAFVFLVCSFIFFGFRYAC